MSTFFNFKPSSPERIDKKHIKDHNLLSKSVFLKERLNEAATRPEMTA